MVLPDYIILAAIGVLPVLVRPWEPWLALPRAQLLRINVTSVESEWDSVFSIVLPV